MARKYFKIILHRDVVGKKDFSYIDIESSGRVSTCFSNVRLSEEMKKIPAGKYELGFMIVSRRMQLAARRNDIYFSISYNDMGRYPYVRLYEGETYNEFMTAKMHWQNIHRETYLSGRDGYDADIEIVEERNLKRINFI